MYCFTSSLSSLSGWLSKSSIWLHPHTSHKESFFTRSHVVQLTVLIKKWEHHHHPPLASQPVQSGSLRSLRHWWQTSKWFRTPFSPIHSQGRINPLAGPAGVWFTQLHLEPPQQVRPVWTPSWERTVALFRDREVCVLSITPTAGGQASVFSPAFSD